MKIDIDKEINIDANSAKVKADKDYVLVVKATDCDVDMNMGRVIIKGKRISITERKINRRK